jgi:hypothetical protein
MLAALKSLIFPEPSKAATRRADLLAFRTITTLLALFQPHDNRDPQKHTTAERNELMVLDSLAALFTRQHEVAAVSSIEQSSTNVEVLVSVVHHDNSEPLFTDIFPQPTYWLTSANPRTNSPKSNYAIDPSLTSNDISLADPDESIPENLLASKEKARNLFDTFLRTQW